MSLDPDPKRLVFVGGLHRSGTTPFAKILDEPPGDRGLVDTGVREDEGQHLQRGLPQGEGLRRVRPVRPPTRRRTSPRRHR